MKQNIKELWIKALMGGLYLQGTGQLFDGEHYCCLGVLCGIHKKVTKDGEWDENGNYCQLSHELEQNRDVLPDFVMDWAGLDSPDPYIHNRFNSLAGLNDDGASFQEIAKIIKVEL